MQNVGLNKTEKAVLVLLIETPDKAAEEMASIVGVTKRTIERAFVSLQKKGKVERVGSKRDGMWVVIK
ncbi:Sugar-specific transcriptional regulator TrmB [Lachnospiraceae bacterium XBB1006]|nr:Sugar-specific transcriptional regulator TrmB [Lachnospiraceae bacterium XBB1006]